jgi:uncharacterized membrane protein
MAFGMNPFDWRTVVLAKHAQHVALIHFPIALFIAAAGFDFAWTRWRRPELAAVTFWNMCAAALATLPALATGLIAWQWQLEGQRLKGTLLLHLLAAASSAIVIWVSFLIHVRVRRTRPDALLAARLFLELLGVALLMLTGHLGGFLSGVNGAL